MDGGGLVELVRSGIASEDPGPPTYDRLPRCSGVALGQCGVRVIQKEGKHTDLRSEVFDLEAVSGGNARVDEFLVVVVERELLVERRDPLPRHLEL